MKKPTFDQLDSFTQGYIEALFFTELPEHRQRPGEIREWFDFADAWHQLSRKTQDAIRADCDDFQKHNARQLEEYPGSTQEAGRDFWYSRNGHGCGFWEKDCAALQCYANTKGSQETYWHKGRLYLYGVN